MGMNRAPTRGGFNFYIFHFIAFLRFYDAIIVTSQNFLTVLEHNAFEMMKLASYKALVLQGRVYIKYMKFYL